ncbi:hypothetical protein G9C98_007822, partial [Cotesia typhae]
ITLNTKGLKYAIAWNRTSMKIVGLWPEPDDGVINKLKGWFSACLIILIIYLPQSASVYCYWGNMDAVIECLSINGPVLITIVKIIIFRYNRKVLQRVINVIEKDWSVSRSDEEFAVMLKTAKISRAISVISTAITNSLFVAYIFFKESNEMSKRTDLDPRLSVGLLHPAYFPYDTKKIRFFVPTWIAQLIATFFSMTAYAVFDTFMSCIVLHICGQLAVVGIALRKLINENTKNNPRKFWSEFSIIVERHEKLNELAKVIEDSFSSILLPQMIICTTTFCFQGFAMISSFINPLAGKVSVLEMLFSIVYVFYTVLHLFVYCYVGGYLSFESSRIGETYYKGNWYNLSVDKSRSLMFVGHRARRPLKITAGKFCAFSRNLFLVVLKTSFGYLSMLLAVKKGNPS